MSDLREKLQAVSDATRELLIGPDEHWREGMSSAEWYRRAIRKRDGLSTCRRAIEDALNLVRSAEAESSKMVDSARSAVLEDAARGDIQ
jgi:hypothetical protein